ncbi:hypothetical protein [Furfurilactobacillus milii]|uniref:Uncharacterized protein n=1 Tax=Furfurilactobacillus milii TaxID=2888272 RepID=A0A6N9I025_9LACO|nr:hypothetical protein [Furfurilactobacillus milii]MYV16341.1 hypothetical protein [Furfurilactobacillus milii]
MKRLNEYKPNGEIYSSVVLNFDSSQPTIDGQKGRVTVTGGNQYIGYIGNYFKRNETETFDVCHYDIDEENDRLKSDVITATIIPLSCVTQIEVILFSSPRWDSRMTNKFVFLE